jgi:hypothetical protein
VEPTYARQERAGPPVDDGRNPGCERNTMEMFGFIALGLIGLGVYRYWRGRTTP